MLPTDGVIELDTVRIADIYKRDTSRLIKPANLWTDKVDHWTFMFPTATCCCLPSDQLMRRVAAPRLSIRHFINSNHAIEIDCSAAFFENLSALLASTGWLG